LEMDIVLSTCLLVLRVSPLVERVTIDTVCVAIRVMNRCALVMHHYVSSTWRTRIFYIDQSDNITLKC
jgi:hypothetical protein